MNISEMHKLFRQFAQQMGMQNVRGILPEQIDLVLKASISDTINQIIAQHISLTRGDGSIDNTKLGQINALRTLYKAKEVEFPSIELKNNVYTYYGKTDDRLDFEWNGDYNDAVFVQTKDVLVDSLLMLVDFAIKYHRCKDNNHGWEIDENGSSETVVNGCYVPVRKLVNGSTRCEFITPYFKIRTIEDSFLQEVISDDILKPKYSSPIAVYTNDKLELHLGALTYNGFFDKDLSPNSIRVSYIAKPAEVHLKTTDDIEDVNVDCDLPEYLHVNIVKQAVLLWQQSVGIPVQANGNNAATQSQR